MSELIVETREVTEYTPEVAAGIGRLMPHLDPNFSGEPVPEGRLRKIIDSPYHGQLIAVRNKLVVGAATMSLVMGAGFGERGQLEDFVVDPEIRRAGIGGAVWESMYEWCRQNVSDVFNGVNEFGFETELFRPDAIDFYEKNGAEIVPDTFHLRAVVPEQA